MSNKHEPAFPTKVQRGQSGEYWTEDEGGLTKREYAAIQILAGMGDIGGTSETIALIAIRRADALLAELAK